MAESEFLEWMRFAKDDLELRYPFQLVGGEGMEELAMKAAEHVASIVEGLFNA